MGPTLKNPLTLILIGAWLLAAACTKPNPDLILIDASEDPLDEASSTETGDDTSDSTSDDGLDTGELSDLAVCAATSEVFTASCAACLAESCCDALTACVEAEGCTCATACALELDAPTCLLGCVLGTPPADSVALVGCMNDACADACGLGAEAQPGERLP